MKKILIILITIPLIFNSCSSEKSIEGTWEYDSWVINGDKPLTNVTPKLIFCEEQKFFACEIYDNETESLTERSISGTYILNNEQTKMTITLSHSFDSMSSKWLAISPTSFSYRINKLDDDELDISFITNDGSGVYEVITSVKSSTETTCSLNGLANN
jgi:hypothetical protein